MPRHSFRDLAVPSYDNPLLRQKSQKLKKIDDATQTLIDDMLETMTANNGVGLAAGQVGVLQRVIRYRESRISNQE